jgi:hypothetical protein
MYAILIVIEVSIRQLTRLTTGPGRFTAEGVIWIAIVNILATFQIVKSKDIFGEEINVKKEFTAGIAVCVKLLYFSCLFLTITAPQPARTFYLLFC